MLYMMGFLGCGKMERDLRGALADIRGFLLDLDGTFYLGNKLLEGSLAFLEKLRITGRSALFLTNNSSKSGEAYVQKLRGMGVEEPFLRVLTSGQVTGRYAMAHHPGKKAFVLGNEELRNELSSMGVPQEQNGADYLIAGYDTSLDYAKMAKACDLVRSGLPYIATHPDVNCPTEEGFAPDIGAIIAFIKASTGRKPDEILGKPYRGIVMDALERIALTPGELAMVGDRLYTDIATGVNYGILSILVLTGETKARDLQKSKIRPDFVVERLSQLIEFL